jgi:hypothetical protein
VKALTSVDGNAQLFELIELIELIEHIELQKPPKPFGQIFQFKSLRNFL